MRERVSVAIGVVLLGVAWVWAALPAGAQGTPGAQGGVESYGVPGVNGARVFATGSADLRANGGAGDLVLHAAGVPPGARGLFLYGDVAAGVIPFGYGYRLVAGTRGLGRLAPVEADAAGAVAQRVDYIELARSAHPIRYGSRWHFQLLFRYRESFDLTDALAIEFGPPPPLAPFDVLLAGDHSGHALAERGGVEIVTDLYDWTVFWAQHASGGRAGFPPPPPIEVDFERSVLVAVFAGRRDSGGYEIAVDGLRLSVTTLYVDTLETAPAAGCLVPSVITTPFQIVRIPRVEHLVLGAWTARRSHDASCD